MGNERWVKVERTTHGCNFCSGCCEISYPAYGAEKSECECDCHNDIETVEELLQFRCPECGDWLWEEADSCGCGWATGYFIEMG